MKKKNEKELGEKKILVPCPEHQDNISYLPDTKLASVGIYDKGNLSDQKKDKESKENSGNYVTFYVTEFSKEQVKKYLKQENKPDLEDSDLCVFGYSRKICEWCGVNTYAIGKFENETICNNCHTEYELIKTKFFKYDEECSIHYPFLSEQILDYIETYEYNNGGETNE